MKAFYLFTTLFFLLGHYSCDKAPTSLSTDDHIDRFLGIDSPVPFRWFGEEIEISQPAKPKPKPKAKNPPPVHPQCPYALSIYFPNFKETLEIPEDDFLARSTNKVSTKDIYFEKVPTNNTIALTPMMEEVCQKIEDHFSKGDGIMISQLFNRSQILELVKEKKSGFLAVRHFLTVPLMIPNTETLFELYTSCNFTTWAPSEGFESNAEVTNVNVTHLQESCPFSLQRYAFHHDKPGIFWMGIQGEFRHHTEHGLKLTLKSIYFEQKTINV